MYDKDKFDKMLAAAKGLLSASAADSFCISSLIPERWLIEEERTFDSALANSESIKSSINRRIVGTLCKVTGKKYNSDAGIRVVLDFNSYVASLKHENTFVFGRYKKFSRELSQSRWLCSKCEGEGCFKCYYEGKNYISVEELIGDVFKKYSECSDYSLHASGREDVDVTNVAGRPFVLELKEPKQFSLDLLKIAKEIGNDNKVVVLDLKFVKRSFVEIVSNSHFDKEYEADIELSRELTDQDLEKLKSLEGTTIDQQTPHRVAHRRADLIRKRIIKRMEILNNDKNKLKIRLLAEPGTYIKELIHGDKGNTKPSVSSILGCDAKCTCLTVIKIQDGFLDLLS